MTKWPSTYETTSCLRLYQCSIQMVSLSAIIGVHSVHLIWIVNGLLQVWSNVQKTALPKWWWEKLLKAVISCFIAISMVTQDAKIYSCMGVPTRELIVSRNVFSHYSSTKTQTCSSSTTATFRYKNKRRQRAGLWCGKNSSLSIPLLWKHHFVDRRVGYIKIVTSPSLSWETWASNSVLLFVITLVMSKKSEKPFKNSRLCSHLKMQRKDWVHNFNKLIVITMGLEISSVAKLTMMTKRVRRRSRKLILVKMQMAMEMLARKFLTLQVNRTEHRMETTERRNQKLSLRKLNDHKYYNNL